MGVLSADLEEADLVREESSDRLEVEIFGKPVVIVPRTYGFDDSSRFDHRVI